MPHLFAQNFPVLLFANPYHCPHPEVLEWGVCIVPVTNALNNICFVWYPWQLLWYLEMKLKRKRQCDPALSWVDRCEAPSMM